MCFYVTTFYDIIACHYQLYSILGEENCFPVRTKKAFT